MAISGCSLSRFRGVILTSGAATIAGAPDTMICGWAEIDGQPVDVLPAADGKPSRLTRTVQFDILKSDRLANTAKLPD